MVDLSALKDAAGWSRARKEIVESVERLLGQRMTKRVELQLNVADEIEYPQYIRQRVNYFVDDWTREYQAEATATASRAAERVARTWPDIDVRVQAPATPPVLALREASKDAGLLVVGSRRLGRLSRFVLGSVSHDIVQTASCPVAVCRP